MAEAGSMKRGSRRRLSADSAPNDDRPLGDQLINVMRLMRVSSSRTEIAGLSNARYDFLHALVHAGPARMSVLARQLRISPRTVTPMVDALEAEGLVARAPSPNDRRAQVITLTPSGVELIRRARAERIAMTDDLFAPLDPNERRTLGALLDKITETASAGAALPQSRGARISAQDPARPTIA